MMKTLTDQYSDLCNRVARQQQIEFEKKMEEVSRKCVGMLELQVCAFVLVPNFQLFSEDVQNYRKKH